MRVERFVSNCVLTLAETQSKQVEGWCTQLGVSRFEGNAFASLVSAQIAHSI